MSCIEVNGGSWFLRVQLGFEGFRGLFSSILDLLLWPLNNLIVFVHYKDFI